MKNRNGNHGMNSFSFVTSYCKGFCWGKQIQTIYKIFIKKSQIQIKVLDHVGIRYDLWYVWKCKTNIKYYEGTHGICGAKYLYIPNKDHYNKRLNQMHPRLISPNKISGLIWSLASFKPDQCGPQPRSTPGTINYECSLIPGWLRATLLWPPAQSAPGPSPTSKAVKTADTTTAGTTYLLTWRLCSRSRGVMQTCAACVNTHVRKWHTNA